MIEIIENISEFTLERSTNNLLKNAGDNGIIMDVRVWMSKM